MGLNKFSSLMDRKRESYLSFEYDKLVNSPSNSQNLAMDQNLSSEDKLKVSRFLSKGVSLFYSIWDKDHKMMPSSITKDNYNEYTLDKYNPAIECFDKILTLDKENTQALEYKAHSLFLNRYFEDAIEIYRIVSKEKNDLASWNDLGVALMEYGLSLNKRHEGKLNLLGFDQLEESIKCFEFALSKNPKNICPTLNLAHLYRGIGNFLPASGYYSRALEIDENIHILTSAAENYLFMNLPDKSKKLYKKAMKINSLFMKEYFEDSVSTLRSDCNEYFLAKMGIELYPDSPYINSQFIEIGLRRLFGPMNEDVEIEDIIKSARKLIELDEHDYVLLELAGLLIKHFPDEILEILDKIDLEKITETRSPSDLSYYGSILSDNGNDKEAKKFYEKSLKAIDKVLLKKKENNYVLRTGYSTDEDKSYFIKSLLEDKIEILINIKDYENAEKSLNQLKEYGIDESEYNREMGIIYYSKAEKEGNKQDKINYYEEACNFFDVYLSSNLEDTFIQILRIDALSNYAERNTVLGSIRTLIKDQNLDAEYYGYLLKLAYNLKDFKLCEEIFYNATSVIEESKKKEFYEIYAQIQKDTGLEDEEKKQQLIEGDKDRNTKRNEIEKKQDRIELKDKEKRKESKNFQNSRLRIEGYEEKYEETKKEIREIVGDKIEGYNDEYDILIKATIDLEINNIRPWKNNSEIVHNFCKAIERLQVHKYRENEGIMNEIINFVDIDNTRNCKIPFKTRDEQKQHWITDMQEQTLISKNNNAFYPPAVAEKMFRIFFNYNKNKNNIHSHYNEKMYYEKWDIFAFNTIFFFYHIKKNIDENKFNLFKDIYRLYTYRTNASHKDIITIEDAMTVRKLVFYGQSLGVGIAKGLIDLDNS